MRNKPRQQQNMHASCEKCSTYKCLMPPSGMAGVHGYSVISARAGATIIPLTSLFLFWETKKVKTILIINYFTISVWG